MICLVYSKSTLVFTVPSITGLSIPAALPAVADLHPLPQFKFHLPREASAIHCLQSCLSLPPLSLLSQHGHVLLI